MRRRPRLPLQTVIETDEFIQSARQRQADDFALLIRDGYKVVLAYIQTLGLDDDTSMTGVVVVHNASGPYGTRRHEWLPNYLEQCIQLAQDAVLVDTIWEPELIQAIRELGFEESCPLMWIYRKS